MIIEGYNVDIDWIVVHNLHNFNYILRQKKKQKKKKYCAYVGVLNVKTIMSDFC